MEVFNNHGIAQTEIVRGEKKSPSYCIKDFILLIFFFFLNKSNLIDGNFILIATSASV